MDYKNAIAEEKPNSLFQLNRSFCNKIIGRNSFKEDSMRMFYTENAAAVPFEWEMQPGTPKHPQTETIQPIKPQPAAHSQASEKPTFPSSSHVTVSCFLRRRRSSKKGRKAKAAAGHRERHGASEGENSAGSLESSDVNGDSKPSFDHSRSSSSSSSFSSSSSSSSSSLRGLAKGLWVKLSS